MATPVIAQSTNLFMSCFSILILTGLNRYSIQNKTTQTPTRTTFIPNGPANCWLVRCFTALRFMAKNRLVKSRAKWAVVFLFNYGFLYCKNKGIKKAIPHEAEWLDIY